MADLGTTAGRNAFEFLRGLLGQYGLETPDLVELARNSAINDLDGNQFLQELRQSPTYKQAFPGMEARRKAGLPPIDEGTYLTFKATAKRLMQDAGLPAGFYDQEDDYTSLIAGDVSVAELSSRLGQGLVAASQAPQDVKDQLFQLYGVTPGQMAAYFIDPVRGSDAIAKQVAAAGIGAAGARSGYGQITQGQAENLAGFGMTAGQAAQGFAQLAQEKELFAPLPGETGRALSQEEQVASLTGAASAQEIEKRARQRKAVFDAGGGFAADKGGISGLGPSG